MRIIIATVLVLIIASSSLAAQSIPPMRPFSDEESIRIIIQQVEQGIRDQDVLSITDGFSRVYNISDTTTARFLLWERLADNFRRAEARRNDALFQVLTPPQAGLSSTWDFEMEIDTVRFLGGGNALAETWIYFRASQPDSSSKWRFGKKHRENILFEKIESEWRIKQVHSLNNMLILMNKMD